MISFQKLIHCLSVTSCNIIGSVSPWLPQTRTPSTPTFTIHHQSFNCFYLYVCLVCTLYKYLGFSSSLQSIHSVPYRMSVTLLSCLFISVIFLGGFVLTLIRFGILACGFLPVFDLSSPKILERLHAFQYFWSTHVLATVPVLLPCSYFCNL